LEIIGLFLVHNEDLYIGQAIINVIDFCDTIIVANHRSTDRTSAVVAEIAQSHNKVQLVDITDPSESQSLIHKYVGTTTWIFGVDGDEIYDPQRLRTLREKLQIGSFSEYFRIVGNVLHCRELDNNRSRAKGYLAPPSRSMTKLFNFAALSRWDGPFTERLHGGNLTFVDGFDQNAICRIHHETPWEQSDLRCLHLCFLERSSIEPANKGTRLNIMEQTAAMSSRKTWIKTQFLKYLWGKSGYKRRNYMRGPVVEYDVRPFFIDYQSEHIDPAHTNS